jgi:hypothetical protein
MVTEWRHFKGSVSDLLSIIQQVPQSANPGTQGRAVISG